MNIGRLAEALHSNDTNSLGTGSKGPMLEQLIWTGPVSFTMPSQCEHCHYARTRYQVTVTSQTRPDAHTYWYQLCYRCAAQFIAAAALDVTLHIAIDSAYLAKWQRRNHLRAA